MKTARSIGCAAAGLILALPLAAQPAFIEVPIDSTVTQAAALAIGDLNGDSLWDVVCASDGNTTTDCRGVVCRLGADSLGRHWISQPVDSQYYRPISVEIGDLDGDGSPDVIACSWDSASVDWWHNGGGSPLAWTRHQIDGGFVSAHEVHAVDVDQDGHLDIIAAGADNNNQIAIWYNDGGPVPLWTKQVVDFSFGGARSVVAADFDGDGDVDLAGAALLDNEVAWWRNDGGWPITWTKSVIDGAFSLSHRLNLSDIDQDGKTDLIGAAYGGAIAWWRNIGGNPLTWEKQTIQSSYTGALVAHAADIDNDGDIDVVGTNQPLNEVCVWVNQGGWPIAWEKHSLPYQGPWPIMPWDIDRDGDADVVTGGRYSMSWFENISNYEISATPPHQIVSPGGSAQFLATALLRYGAFGPVPLTAVVSPAPVTGSIDVSFEHNPLAPDDSCIVTVASSGNIAPGRYDITVNFIWDPDTLADTVSLEITGTGQAVCVGADHAMMDMIRGVWTTADSLWRVPTGLGPACQALVLEHGAVPGDTAAIRQYIEGGGTVLLTRHTPNELCGSSTFAPISGWIGAGGYGNYGGSGIAIISTYDHPFGEDAIHANDTLGRAVPGFGYLSGLVAAGVRVARLGSLNSVMAGVYCASGAGHCLYYTSGAGISPKSDSLLAGFLRHPSLGVEIEPGPDDAAYGDIGMKAYPNPVRTGTAISFSLTEQARVRLEVYDILGRAVRTLANGLLPPGSHAIRWDGRDGSGRRAAAGVYFIRGEWAGNSRTRRLTVIR